MDEYIAFFSLEPTQDNKGQIGAMLVTDDLGMPQEFRVTYPVKPTNLQKQLYGESLNGHIGVTLCGQPLYRALQHKPELILVSQRQFLSLADEVESKVAHVKRSGETIVVGETGDESPNQNIHSKSGRFQPVNIFFPLDLDGEEQAEITSTIEKYFQGIDLLEPFDRIKSALEALAEQDEKFR
ncbi:MAG: hypothetical protein ISR58_20285 [Anaerolineales bacterium]|nr:hypothetical protein [Chloroflexota bacterium]MBL6983526.1 hypothetical protein [Anaerolineales bacterium]